MSGKPTVPYDARDLFEITPDEIVTFVEDTALPGIESGTDVISAEFLPYIEREAIDRLRRAGYSPANAPNMRADPVRWRDKWVREAALLAPHFAGNDGVPRAAVSILLTASRLRFAMDNESNPQLIAALSMMIVCEAIQGGFSINFADLKAAHRKAKLKAEKSGRKQSVRASAPRGTITDRGQRVHDALKSMVARPDFNAFSAKELWPHVKGLLDTEGLDPLEIENVEKPDNPKYLYGPEVLRKGDLKRKTLTLKTFRGYLTSWRDGNKSV